MQNRLRVWFAVVVLGVGLVPTETSHAASRDALRIDSMSRPDGVRELEAAGVIDAPPDVVFRVLCDVNLFRELVPHLRQFRVLAEDARGATAYQRLEVPALGARDFTVRHTCDDELRADGSHRWVNRWWTDNAAGPPRKEGVVRLERNEGSWTLGALDDGRRTFATYRIAIDPGAELPAFFVHAVMEWNVPQLFDDLEQVSRRVAGAPRR